MGDPYQELCEAPSSFPGNFSLPTSVRYLMGCASFEQFCGTLRALVDPASHCPFCKTRDRSADCVAQTDGWSLIENAYPKAALRRMLLIVPKRHVLDMHALGDEDWAQIGKLFLRAVQEGADGGALVMRFGDPSYHSGTMPHLHLNILCPTGEREYRAALAKDQEHHALNYERMRSFYEDLIARGGREWLLAS